MRSKKFSRPESLKSSESKLSCTSCSRIDGMVSYTNGRLKYNKLILWRCKRCNNIFISGEGFTQVEPDIIGPDPCFNLNDFDSCIKKLKSIK